MCIYARIGEFMKKNNMQAAVKKKRPFDDFRRHKTYYFMLIPMVVFFLLFCYLPMPGLYYAFVDYDFMQGLRSRSADSGILNSFFQEAWIPSSGS